MWLSRSVLRRPVKSLSPMSNPNSSRKLAVDAALANPALQGFELFKRKPAGGEPPAAAPAVGSEAPMAAPAAAPVSPLTAPLDDTPGVAGVAAVTVDATGKILAVDAGCTAMFGWKGAELVGQHLRTIIKEWPDNHLAKFLQKGGRTDSTPLSLKVTGKRMDGREFTVTMTRLSWAANATSKMSSGPAPEYWTALFGEVVDPSNPASRRHDGAAGGGVSGGRFEDAAQFKGSLAALRSANEELQRKLEAMAVDAWKKG